MELRVRCSTEQARQPSVQKFVNNRSDNIKMDLKAGHTLDLNDSNTVQNRKELSRVKKQNPSFTAEDQIIRTRPVTIIAFTTARRESQPDQLT